MQLTKTDITVLYQCDNCRFITEVDEFERCPECENTDTFVKIELINILKFQQVMEFYEKYKDPNGFILLEKDYPDIYNLYKSDSYNRWLFHFCFDGMKK